MFLNFTDSEYMYYLGNIRENKLVGGGFTIISSYKERTLNSMKDILWKRPDKMGGWGGVCVLFGLIEYSVSTKPGTGEYVPT